MRESPSLNLQERDNRTNKSSPLILPSCFEGPQTCLKLQSFSYSLSSPAHPQWSWFPRCPKMQREELPLLSQGAACSGPAAGNCGAAAGRNSSAKGGRCGAEESAWPEEIGTEGATKCLATEAWFVSNYSISGRVK